MGERIGGTRRGDTWGWKEDMKIWVHGWHRQVGKGGKAVHPVRGFGWHVGQGVTPGQGFGTLDWEALGRVRGLDWEASGVGPEGGPGGRYRYVWCGRDRATTPNRPCVELAGGHLDPLIAHLGSALKFILGCVCRRPMPAQCTSPDSSEKRRPRAWRGGGARIVVLTRYY